MLRYPHSHPATTRSILTRALMLCPELVPPAVRASRSPDEPAPSIELLRPLVIEEGCGLRPARHRGIRLEVEWREVVWRIDGGQGDGASDTDATAQKADKVVVVHNYG
jgi:hypothetical protein